MTTFEFTYQDKVTFFLARTCALPFNFVLERDPKNIFYNQHGVEDYMDQVCDFLLFDKHEYTNRIFQSLILGSVFMLRVYVTFSLLLKIWSTESILIIFWEQLFRRTCFLLASNTLGHKFFWWNKQPSWNDAAYDCKEKLWPKVDGEYQTSWSPFFKIWEKYHIYMTQLSLQSL